MKFQEGDLVFLIEPHVSADLGKVLDIYTDSYGDTGYIIEFWWQKKNTLASGDEYIPHFYNIDTWENFLYHPKDKKKAVFLFLFDYDTFRDRFVNK